MNLTADKFISLSEEAKLFKAIARATEAGDRAARVDYMLFSLLNLTGLRISEALALRWSDVGEDYLLVTQKKGRTKSGNAYETVHIGNKLISMLASYRENTPHPGSEYLFNTQKGPMGRTTAHERLKYWLKIAKLREDISCHAFRHSYATRCLDAGLPLAVVRDQLRHSSIAVTSVYLHFSKENKEKLKEVF